MRSNFAKFKELGVTDEHRATAIAMIERTKPIMAKNARNSEKFLTEQQLNQAKEQIDPNISMLAKANQTYYGKVLQSGAQGTVQNTKRWACLPSSNPRPENRERVHAHIH